MKAEDRVQHDNMEFVRRKAESEGRRLLLHACCAPDATVPWADLASEGYDVLPYWYGCNIHPADEEARRRGALQKLEMLMGGEVVYSAYHPEKWFDALSRLAEEPEGGRRCPLCFRLQLEAAAEAAVAAGATLLCTTLTISPHKKVDEINDIGEECAARRGLEWLPRVFRKGGGFVRSIAMSREHGLYRQSYCGCLYSIPHQE